MWTSSRYLVALSLATGGAYALFPDCTNGPLKNVTICDKSASMLNEAKQDTLCDTKQHQHRLKEPNRLLPYTLLARRSMQLHLAREAWSDLAYLRTNGGMKDCTVF
jgi:hypothetical protein